MEQIYEKPLLPRSSLLHHCIDWLDQQGVKLPEQCNTPTRFCLALRDGVLLCSLLVKFDSACLDGAYVISQDHIQSRPERKVKQFNILLKLQVYLIQMIFPVSMLCQLGGIFRRMCWQLWS